MEVRKAMKLKVVYNKTDNRYALVDTETGEPVENLVSLRFGYSAFVPVFEIVMYLDREYLEFTDGDVPGEVLPINPELKEDKDD